MGLTSKLGDRFRSEFIARIISTVSASILTIALARLLNPDSYGVLFLAISIFGIVKLFSKLGIAKSAARYITEYKEQDPGQVPHIIRYSLFLNTITIVVACVIFWSFSDLIVTLVGEPSLIPLLGIGVLYVAFGTLMGYVRKILQGLEAIQAAATVYIINRSGRLIFVLLFVLLGFEAVGALIGYVVAFAISAVVGLFYIYLTHYRKRPKSEQSWELKRRIIEYSIPLTVTSTANVLEKRVDIVLIGFFVGSVGVAYYTIAKQVVESIEAPMSALGFALSPTYNAQKSKGQTEKAARIFEEALSHGLLLYIPAAAGMIVISEPMVEIIFGREYIGAVPILQILAIYAVLLAIVKITSDGLDYLGRARERAIVKGTTSVFNVILNIILLPIIGVVGAAIATVITFGIYTLACIYIMNYELDLRVIHIIKFATTTLLITLVMVVVVYSVLGFVTGVITLIAAIVVGVLVWMTLSVMVGVLDIQKVVSIIS